MPESTVAGRFSQAAGASKNTVKRYFIEKLPLSVFASDVAIDRRRRLFFHQILAERGAAAAAGGAYFDLYGGRGTALTWADTFRDYLHGRGCPRAKSLWRFAAAVRKGTKHTWCAGPVALYACSRFSELVAVFAIWTSRSRSDPSALIRALHSAATYLPCDLEPELIALFEQNDVATDRLALDAIQAYEADGDIQDFASAKREYHRRLHARQIWMLEAALDSELDDAWNIVNTDFAGIRDLWTDEVLSVALAVAEAPQVSLHHKRATILCALAKWVRNELRIVA